MATLSFLAGESTTINNLAGSGIGFFADGGFGYAVQVGAYNTTAYITNAAGTSQGPQIDGWQYKSASTGTLSSVDYRLKTIPNYLSSLNIRLTNATAITTQNGKVYIYDRVNKNNNPSGVTLQIAEIRHPWTATTPDGSGSTSWTNAAGSGSTLSITNSPGLSGELAGSNVQHDWYFVLSASPTSIGSKTQFGLWMEVEYA